MTASFTLGPSWVDQYVSSIMLLNTLLGHPANAGASRAATPESVIRTLQQIARGRYAPEAGTQNGSPETPALKLTPPALVPSEIYLVIVLNASTPTSDFASVDAGGVIFEDPAWAVLAAHAIAQAPRFEQDLRVGAPLASDNADLWRRLGLIQEAILDDKYSERHFFGGLSGFMPASQSEPGPEFRLMQVTSEQMGALRARGLQTFGNPMRLYELFQRPPLAR